MLFALCGVFLTVQLVLLLPIMHPFQQYIQEYEQCITSDYRHHIYVTLRYNVLHTCLLLWIQDKYRKKQLMVYATQFFTRK